MVDLLILRDHLKVVYSMNLPPIIQIQIWVIVTKELRQAYHIQNIRTEEISQVLWIDWQRNNLNSIILNWLRKEGVLQVRNLLINMIKLMIRKSKKKSMKMMVNSIVIYPASWRLMRTLWSRPTKRNKVNNQTDNGLIKEEKQKI